ncbi:MAG: FAD-binding protein [bacterium]|nr:FAD-binding protein [bacterium]
MDQKFKLLATQLGEHRLKFDVDITEHLKSGLGGQAEAFYIATSIRELVKALEDCQDLRIPVLIIGLGSKVAISEAGLKGLVIKNRSDSMKIFGIKGKVSKKGIGIEEAFLEAESGVTLARLAEYATSQGLGGLEVFRSNLGTLGGSLYITPALKEKIHQVKVFTSSGEVENVEVPDLKREDIILSVVFKLQAKKP